MKANCPHCNTEIDFVTTSDILREAGISQGTLVDWRKNGRFPAEWAVIARRPVWLSSDVQDFLSSWESRKSERIVEKAEEMLRELSPQARRRALERLDRELVPA